MTEAICLLALALLAVLYIFGYVHDFIFLICEKMESRALVEPKWNSIYSKPSEIPHWRKMNYNLGYECSECGYEAETEHKTCPNCNAKMMIAKETKT